MNNETIYSIAKNAFDKVSSNLYGRDNNPCAVIISFRTVELIRPFITRFREVFPNISRHESRLVGIAKNESEANTLVDLIKSVARDFNDELYSQIPNEIDNRLYYKSMGIEDVYVCSNLTHEKDIIDYFLKIEKENI